MASVDVAVSSDLTPERAWELASNLRRFDEWLTIFGGWRGEVPAEIEVGTCVSSQIKVKGFRNTIHWRVTRYDEPKEIELIGTGFPAICIALSLHVQEEKVGTNFRVVADLSGGLLNTRVGGLVARVIESDVRKSVTNLASLH
ncbi:type II toxin-antitoxin system Rv0910 family toxin [Mycolicibacterium baixiangningiae]|uniref:type II toxin-antitoxin system Rv0910 family toxin n=1 Tax=Mycolicibacterium baixiangningiae TaxID=2761578 RepID=UPI001867F08C|nr:SRPBCC family protein [Mycolicibacterium baixiangningiae]